MQQENDASHTTSGILLLLATLLFIAGFVAANPSVPFWEWVTLLLIGAGILSMACAWAAYKTEV